MSFWRYWWERCRNATREAWRFSGHRIVWGCLVMVGAFAAGILMGQYQGLSGSQLLWSGIICGIAGLAFATAVVWLVAFVRAPYLRDREQRTEIARLQDVLDPDFSFDVRGPELLEAQGQVFLIFFATARSGAETRLSLLPRLRMEVVSGLKGAVEAEQSPIRAWEDIQRQSPGGPPAHLAVPLDLEPGKSASGYLGFWIPPILLAIARQRRVVELAIQTEELGSKKRSQDWFSSVNVIALGLKEPTPPAGPPPTTAE